MHAYHQNSFVARWQQFRVISQRCFIFALLLLSAVMVSCSGPNGNNSPSPIVNATPSNVSLSKLHWCTKSLILFRDEGASATVTPTSGTPTATTMPAVTATTTATGTPTGTATAGTTPTAATPTVGPGTPTTLTDWAKVQPYLGFAVYLPATLQSGTCLVSVSGTIHDPIFGGSFIIGYLLPDKSSISLAEAPLRSQAPAFQCSPSGSLTPRATRTVSAGTPSPLPNASPTQGPGQVCSGARDKTNIYFSAHGSTAELQQFFNALQPNVDWIPAS